MLIGVVFVVKQVLLMLTKLESKKMKKFLVSKMIMISTADINIDQAGIQSLGTLYKKLVVYFIFQVYRVVLSSRVFSCTVFSISAKWFGCKDGLQSDLHYLGRALNSAVTVGGGIIHILTGFPRLLESHGFFS